jgi:hypothetical protein
MSPEHYWINDLPVAIRRRSTVNHGSDQNQPVPAILRTARPDVVPDGWVGGLRAPAQSYQHDISGVKEPADAPARPRLPQ